MQVFALDKVPDRLKLAEEFGATPINGEDVDAAVAAVKDATDGRGVDCAMEAVGHQATVNLGFNMLRMGGEACRSHQLQNPVRPFSSRRQVHHSQNGLQHGAHGR